ncbi:GYDIA family GHMP kinase [Pontimicrobium sp. SW4]|uniref:GYDIA family GHMP kinase n=1 Tax=Pontimicrobium sp. SW4 TaxID=3153519 RepID=A0AAU7BTK8_9FLAO
MNNFYSNGKLLITGEYTVLDGALALALPTKHGQSLNITNIIENNIIWKSIDNKNQIWFEEVLPIEEIALGVFNTRNEISKKLIEILHAAKVLNSSFLDSKAGFCVTTKLGFPTNWGLGSSSTLINNIANWAKIDAYKLLELTFGGSGYDIACAQHNQAITYQLTNSHREINKVEFNPKFKDHLYFVHLNKKKNSREGIIEYNKNKQSISAEINDINTITQKIINCTSLENFNLLIDSHEIIISSIIKQKTIKDLLFNDFKGSIKSLGAWGGDFILVSTLDNPSSYFKEKGYPTIIPFKDMILN